MLQTYGQYQRHNQYLRWVNIYLGTHFVEIKEKNPEFYREQGKMMVFRECAVEAAE